MEPFLQLASFVKRGTARHELDLQSWWKHVCELQELDGCMMPVRHGLVGCGRGLGLRGRDLGLARGGRLGSALGSTLGDRLGTGLAGLGLFFLVLAEGGEGLATPQHEDCLAGLGFVDESTRFVVQVSCVDTSPPLVAVAMRAEDGNHLVPVRDTEGFAFRDGS